MSAPRIYRNTPAERRVPRRVAGVVLLVLAADLAYIGIVTFFGGRPEANAHPFIRHGGECHY